MSADNTTNEPQNHTTPDTGWKWNPEPETIPTTPELTVLTPIPDTKYGYRDYVDVGGEHNHFDPECIGFVVDGLDEYLEEHAVRELETPTYYSDIEDGMVFIAEETTLGEGAGSGLTGERLEKAVRFATGGGSFRSDDLTITVCDSDTHLFVIQYGDDSYVAALNAAVSKPEDYTYTATETVNGITIRGEERDSVLDGVEYFMDFLETHFNISITGFDHRSESALWFNTDTGHPIRMKGQDLANVANSQIETTPENIIGEHEYEVYNGPTVTYTVDDLEFDIGDSRSEFSQNMKCWGYKLTERCRLLGTSEQERFRAELSYKFLAVIDPEESRYDYISTRITDSSRVVKKQMIN